MNDAVVLPWTSSDPLGEALHFLRMSGSFYGRSDLTAPWGVTLPAMPGCMWFHIVTSGRCLLTVAESEPCLIQPGELALVPHGQGHLLQSDLGAKAPSIFDIEREMVSERYEIIRYGGGGDPTTLICGAVQFDHPAGFNLIELLPKIVYVKASGSLQDWMHSTVQLIAMEAAARRPGGETVITHLSDILVIQAIRSWIETDPAGRSGWLGALRDPQIGRAISLVHHDPARLWRVEDLANELAMSRSAFSARFTELVGEPPMAYLARWRIQLAHQRLKDTDESIRLIAGRLGYGSEAAFSRAFKRIVGVAPGSVRRNGSTTVIVEEVFQRGN